MNQRKYASQPRGGVNQSHVNGNIIFIYELCQKLDMDKNDLLSFFQELRLVHGEEFYNKNGCKIFEDYDISKLDIKRIYRYLDKNVKKELLIEDENSDDECF